ncbi:GNAT family N-acetyltransferase [Propionibacteriaceae bacterium G1746]
MSKKPIEVLVVVASVRPVRHADAVLEWWQSATAPAVESTGAVVRVADLRQLPLPMGDEPQEPHSGSYAHEHTRAWGRLVDAADAFVVITSEHNHSMPASLKNAFDHLVAEWAGKPVAWVSYGNTSAGTRALLAAKQVTTTLGMYSTGPDVSFRLSEWTDGQPQNAPARAAAAAVAVQQLVQVARALRPLRSPALDIAGLPEGLVASVATVADADELLVLQRCCWVDEALANHTLDVPAWRDSAEDVATAIRERLVLVVREGSRIVASAQAWREGTTWWIGRLMVAPDQRRRGIARVLLRHLELERAAGTDQVTLVTGVGSATNIAMYESAGFTVLRSDGAVVQLAKAGWAIHG